MDSFMKIVTDIYGAIAGLPEDSELFHDPDLDLTWIEMLGGPYGGVSRGFSEVRENVFSRIGVHWEDFKFTPANYFEADGAITVEGDYTGVNRETGKKLHARVVHLWKQTGGKIVFEQFTDTAAFLKAMEK